MSRKLNVAVIGAGVADRHLIAFARLADIYDVRVLCALDDPRMPELARQFDIPECSESFAAVVARDDIDIVDICTPPTTHWDMCNRAIDAGKHVICEKPLFGSVAQVDAMAERLAPGDKLLLPIFQYRFANGTQKLRHLMAAGICGRPYLATMETHWARGADYYAVPWRGKLVHELGGCLLGHAIHAHDTLTYLLGPIQSMTAEVATLVNEIEVEDTATLSIRMKSGALAALSVTLGSVDEISRFRFCFENVTVENSQLAYVPGREPWSFKGRTAAIQREIDEALAAFEPQTQGYTEQFRLFHDSVVQGAPQVVTLQDARDSLEFVTAAYHAAATARAVTLPIGAEHPAYAGWADDLTRALGA